jgi:lipoprotein-anchoring transpeptidase ErfK/SrfK
MFSTSALLFAHTLRVLTGLEPGPSEDEVTIAATEVRYIEATHPETVVRGRPWVPYKRVATVADGTRLVVRGVVESRDDKGCGNKPWYAVYPFGFVCSEHVRASKRGPEPGLSPALREGRRVPHEYAFVRTDGVPMFQGYADVDAGVPTRPLTDGMSLVVARTLEYDGREWIQTSDGALVPRDGVRWGGQGSEWAGVELRGEHVGPSFAWTNRTNYTSVRAAPSADAERVAKLDLRTRVPLLERAEGAKGAVFWRVGEDQWIDGADLNEVHLAATAPADVLDDWRTRNTGNDQWIDIDLGEQTLVAYRGGRAVFATMISSGRGSPTPRGNYPVWAKVASTTMANQAYEDKPYMVQGVPWVLLFQGHNALHGAYWHDRFGNRKSHGCVNLAPYDARWVFEWSGPQLPAGWTGYLPSDLRRSVVVHVRDSSRADEFVQDRPIGPPDREAEKARAEAAAQRRAESDRDFGPRYDPSFVPPSRGGEPSAGSAEGPRLEPPPPGFGSQG